jgi:hypothetical protein
MKEWPIFENEQEERDFFDNLDVSDMEFEAMPDEMRNIERQYYRPSPSIQETFLRTVENLSYLQGALRDKKDYSSKLNKIMKQIEIISAEVSNET